MKYTRGFTVVELLVAIVVLVSAGTLFIMQKNDIQMTARDAQRKTAINAIHQSLEEVFFKQNKFYPEKLNADALPSVEASLFTDPSGQKLGEAKSAYRYEPAACEKGKCTSYVLRTTLEKEADYVKRSR